MKKFGLLSVISLVLLSHSKKLVQGLKELIIQMNSQDSYKAEGIFSVLEKKEY